MARQSRGALEIDGGSLTPLANFGLCDFVSDCSAAKSDVRWLLAHVPSLASRSALSSLSSCVMTLDDPPEVDGSDWGVGEGGNNERDGRGDDACAIGEHGEAEFTQRRREELACGVSQAGWDFGFTEPPIWWSSWLDAWPQASAGRRPCTSCAARVCENKMSTVAEPCVAVG